MAKEEKILSVEQPTPAQPDATELENVRNYEVVRLELQTPTVHENALPFNVLTVDLEGSKLIEASAGTGKTYSIAILALRLIIEKKIPVENILMVTFTKAAVAELESRVRKFVRLACKYATGKEIVDITIKQVVGTPNEEKTVLLKKAVQSLDNLSVMTIHSFCLNAIETFTFETDQSFGYEIISEDTDLRKNASSKYFREILNVLIPENFKKMNDELVFDKMHELLKKHISGMKFIDTKLDQNSTLRAIEEQIAGKKEEFDRFIRASFVQIINLPMGNNALLTEARSNNIEEFKRRFRDQIKKPANYFVNFQFMADDFQRCENEIKFAENEFINYFYLSFLNHSGEEIKDIKRKRGFISYDDQIKTIYKALGNESFKEKLGKKYEAVFIDEFQDTDKHQYEIFSKVFSKKAIMYYIGDPKQSIYGWRSADLDTYKAARNNARVSVFTMNRNFRSTQKMIQALNAFLSPCENFNMFKDEDIHYIPVENGRENLGEMLDQGEEVKPVTIWKFGENDFDTNYKVVAQEINRLLTGDVILNGRKITPKDIGVLVREKKEGDVLKRELAVFNIPSVKRDEAKVIDSEESEMVKYLLKAVISPNTGNINRVLHSPYFGFTIKALKTINDERHLEIFLGLKKTMIDEGVYQMISSFLNSYGIRSKCMEDILGQRVLTNINQIAELLHKAEKRNKYTPDELFVWLERCKDEKSEEYEQRVESDEEAVQISTIHKAKGLEYNIVFAPCLSMIPKLKLLEEGNVNDFKKEGEYYFTLNYSALSPEDKKIFDTQKEQENRRLIYVALTRAVYKCYISFIPRIYGRGRKSVPSSLSEIVCHYTNDSELIEIVEVNEDILGNTLETYQPQDIHVECTPRTVPKIDIRNTFGIHSYSALSRAHHSFVFQKTVLKEAYDQFIFQDLGRGANVGTALHSIFERLNFKEPSTWEETLKASSKYYSTIVREEKLEFFYRMAEHVMKAGIKGLGEGFTLGTISNRQKLPELEFCFSMNRVNRSRINEILGDEADLNGDSDIEGLMTGFIDLLFEHKAKYYILDWKSNHLGNSTEDYGQENMEEAMKANNYNLQYMIYTLAVKRWLESRIEGFDYDRQFGGVIYVFLRGVREGQGIGMYVARPDKEKVEELDRVFLEDT